MRNLFKIAFFILLTSCKTIKTDTAEKEVNIDKSSKEIIVITNPKHKSVIFQSEYAKEFAKNDTTLYVFFDIDEENFKFINENLEKEYCKTFNKWAEQYNVEDFQNIKSEIKDCETDTLEYYDRQLIGINNVHGKKAIYIQLLDLRDDQLNLKSSLEKQFIIGYHGWFESSKRKAILFLVDEKKFVMTKEEG